jgi:hypothetical protein
LHGVLHGDAGDGGTVSAEDRGLDGEGPRVRVVYESAAKTHFAVAAGKLGGEPVTVRCNRKGVFACMSGKCYPATSCEHVKEARAFFIASGAEPAEIPAAPVPTEGYRR